MEFVSSISISKTNIKIAYINSIDVPSTSLISNNESWRWCNVGLVKWKEVTRQNVAGQNKISRCSRKFNSKSNEKWRDVKLARRTLKKGTETSRWNCEFNFEWRDIKNSASSNKEKEKKRNVTWETSNVTQRFLTMKFRS